MNFEWDEEKRRQVIRDHGLDFRDIVRAFRGPSLHDHDESHSIDEERWRMLGMADGEVVVIVYIEREETIRLITARRANAEETRLYYEEFFGEPL